MSLNTYFNGTPVQKFPNLVPISAVALTMATFCDSVRGHIWLASVNQNYIKNYKINLISNYSLS